MIQTIWKVNETLGWIGEILQHLLLLAMRLFWGTSFFMSGYAKLQNISNVIEFFERILIPFPTFNAYLVASIETVGGVCLFLGLASRFATIPLICVMSVALMTAHGKATTELYYATANIFGDLSIFIDKVEQAVQQPPFNYLLVSLIVFCFGPGIFSLDFLIEKLFRSKCR